MTLHIYRNSSHKRRIWYPGKSGNCVLTGAYTNNPHVLIRYDVTGPEDAYLSLILSQYKKTNDLAFTLSCYCTEAFTIGKPAKELEYVQERNSAWTKDKSGGPLGTSSCYKNPTFAVAVPDGGALMEIRVSTVKTSAVNVILVSVGSFGSDVRSAREKETIDSGKYRHGFLATERQHVPAGNYALLVTNFHAGVEAAFKLVIRSSAKLKVEEMRVQ